jgi:hypothetical protein
MRHRQPAILTRPVAGPEPARYLWVNPNGAMLWVADPAEATAFSSMREAARMALRLPATDRAFGLPRDVELHGLAS